VHSPAIIPSFPPFVKRAFLRFPRKICCFSKNCVV